MVQTKRTRVPEHRPTNRLVSNSKYSTRCLDKRTGLDAASRAIPTRFEGTGSPKSTLHIRRLFAQCQAAASKLLQANAQGLREPERSPGKSQPEAVRRPTDGTICWAGQLGL